jgi:hypothetical protein
MRPFLMRRSNAGVCARGTTMASAASASAAASAAIAALERSTVNEIPRVVPWRGCQPPNQYTSACLPVRNTSRSEIASIAAVAAIAIRSSRRRPRK